jgi:hypothetical protein
MMSKERELLKKIVEANMAEYMELMILAEELLAKPEQESEQEPEQEPVVWQYRTKPNWTGNWSKWEECRKEAYEDYIRVPILHDWAYETRELYKTPPKREPLGGKRLRDISNSIIAYPAFDNVSVWQVFYIAGALEKALEKHTVLKVWNE